MPLTLDEVRSFAKQKLDEAHSGAEVINFSFSESYHATGKEAGTGWTRGSAPSITDIPKYSVLKHSTGQSAHAVLLCVDLRGSSFMAERIGPEHTYLTMHTYLPTMAYLVTEFSGSVIGLRGDGLFAGFGITELDGDKQVFTPSIAEQAALNSVKCAKAMLEGVNDAVNPVLRGAKIEGRLQLGVGLDVGNIVITRIGLDTANELTAYGRAVNRVCKTIVSNARNSIHASKQLQRIFPRSDKGRIGFRPFSGKDNIYEVEYPWDALERPSNPRHPK